jgi:hypothetical protein
MRTDMCFRADGRPAGRMSAEVCAAWYAVMVPVPPAPPGWLIVPDALLPAGISVGRFDAANYMRNLPPALPTQRLGGSYAYMRRMLRAHRVQMRLAVDLLGDHGLYDAFQERCEAETGTNSFWLGVSQYMDEPDTAPDPEVSLQLEVQALRAEMADRRAFIAATRRLSERAPAA